MTGRTAALRAFLVVVLVSTTAAPSLGQSKSGETQRSWTPSRTPDGQPDIQGMWNNIDSFFTPYERPTELQGKDNMSQSEIRAILERIAKSREEGQDQGTGAGPVHWYEYKAGHLELATSLVVAPASGRVPAMTASARDKMAAIRARREDSYEFMETGDRCISRGILGDMLPTNYNNGKHILQTPGYVVILSEMIHDARIIPIDGRPHLNSKIGQWLGDSRGRWEGNTLIVETTNFNAKAPVRRINVQTENLRMIERFTAVDRNTLRYEVTIEDPTVYTAPWTLSFPYKRDNEYRIFEYACHEGNYAIPNTLSGARAQEREKVSQTSQK
jgi:hypothetical protein